MTSSSSPPRIVRDEPALAAVLLNIKLMACPHCLGTGALIGHGMLYGYAELGSEMMVRGRRLFCSNRGRRPGCGRTFSVHLATVYCGFVVRTLTLWRFVNAVLSGATRRAAWLQAARGALSLSSAYRLWRRLSAAQSTLRVRLSRVLPAPVCDAREPLAQLVAHLGVVVGASVGASVAAAALDPFAAFQCHLQQGLFDR